MLDTFIRLDRAERLLREQGEVELSNLKQLQDDHLNYPQSICHHLAQGDPTMIVSVFAIAMDLKNRVMHVTPGQPCENEFQALELK